MIWVISIYLRLSTHFESLNGSKATNKTTASPFSRGSRDKYIHGSRAALRNSGPHFWMGLKFEKTIYCPLTLHVDTHHHVG